MNKHNTATTKTARVKESFRLLDVEKAPYADYPMDKSMAAFVLATALGHERIFHLAGVEDDPLLGLKMGWD